MTTTPAPTAYIQQLVLPHLLLVDNVDIQSILSSYLTALSKFHTLMHTLSYGDSVASFRAFHRKTPEDIDGLNTILASLVHYKALKPSALYPSSGLVLNPLPFQN